MVESTHLQGLATEFLTLNADVAVRQQQLPRSVPNVHIFLSTAANLAQAESSSGYMAHPHINANMFDRGIHGADTSSYDNGGAQVVPLPLNLIALIISYVHEPNSCAAFLWLTNLLLLLA